MKSLDEFKTIINEDKSEYGKFDMLIRAGLANKSQIARIHKILDKMKQERPVFTPNERAILQDIFNKMVDLVSNNKQIFQQTRRAVREETDEFESEELNESVVVSSDYKISPTSGRKVRARRFKISDDPTATDDGEKEIKEEIELDEQKKSKGTPPFTLILKRKAIRQYPNKTRVALYWSEKLKRYFSVPYEDDSGDITGILQAESFEINESVMDTLHSIVKDKQSKSVKFASGHTRKIDHFTASALTKVHDSLNDDNKKKFSDMVHKSPEHFMKASEFAFKYTK
jgi:hypothetical protein